MTYYYLSEQDDCVTGALERNRYFPRRIMTDYDMTLEQEYFRNRLRLRNRLLWGWGVVCDAQVEAVFLPQDNGIEPWKVKVNCGYILAPSGDEIIIDCERIVDLRSSGAGADQESYPDPQDPWCSNVDNMIDHRPQAPLYVAVRYQEIKSHPVRVQPVGCGCDEVQCEHSRWRDSYDIGLLTHPPQFHEESPLRPNGKELNHCPKCPSEPWVVLAKVDFDPTTGELRMIDNVSDRRLVVPTARYAWKATGDLSPISSIAPQEVTRGATNVELTIRAQRQYWHEPEKVIFADDNGIEVNEFQLSADKYSLITKINVSSTAKIGDRTLIIADYNQNLIVRPDAITITE